MTSVVTCTIFSNMAKQDNSTTSGAQRNGNRAAVFKALAHPSRIRIVEALSCREHCAGELVELVGDDASTISKHLTVLKSAGIVTNARRGTSVFYNLQMTCVTGFMACVDKAIVALARSRIHAAGSVPE